MFSIISASHTRDYVQIGIGTVHLQYARGKMVQLADLFSVPEMGLLCNVAEYFEKNHFDYHPEILFRDVKVSSTWCIMVLVDYCCNPKLLCCLFRLPQTEISWGMPSHNA